MSRSTGEGRGFLISVVLHALLLGSILWGSWSSKPQESAPSSHPMTLGAQRLDTPPVSAVAVDEQAVQSRMAAIRARETAREQALLEEQARLERLKEAAQEAAQRRQKEELALREKEKSLRELQKQQEVMQREQKKQQEEAEKKLKALKAEQERAKIAAQKAEKEKAEQETLAQKKKSKESRDAPKTPSTEKNNGVSSAQGSSRGAASDFSQSQEFLRYQEQIIQAMSRVWIIPEGVHRDLTCTILIRLAPGGVVLDAQLVKSSGNQALDRSALAAVYQASPLPVPSDPQLFESFRSLKLLVRPEAVV